MVSKIYPRVKVFFIVVWRKKISDWHIPRSLHLGVRIKIKQTLPCGDYTNSSTIRVNSRRQNRYNLLSAAAGGSPVIRIS